MALVALVVGREAVALVALVIGRMAVAPLAPAVVRVAVVMLALVAGQAGLVALVVDGRKRPLPRTRKDQLQNIADLKFGRVVVCLANSI